MSLAGTFTYDNLVNGDFPIVTKGETLDTGSLSRGAVLGKISVGAVPTTGTADGGNTGDGTVTSVTGGKATKVGVYTIECIEAVTNGGVFKVTNPDGEEIISNAIIVAGAGGTIAFTSAELNGTITDGSTDFVVGDKFTVTVPAGSGKVVIVDSTNIDGSQNPCAVMLDESADASSGDVEISTALTGQFNETKLSFGGTDTIATHRDALRALSIFTRANVAA